MGWLSSPSTTRPVLHAWRPPPLPRECLLLFGQEGPGVSGAAQAAAAMTVSIAQFGSTRSVNVGVAAGIAMHAWVRQHADLGGAW